MRKVLRTNAGSSLLSKIGFFNPIIEVRNSQSQILELASVNLLTVKVGRKLVTFPTGPGIYPIAEDSYRAANYAPLFPRR